MAIESLQDLVRERRQAEVRGATWRDVVDRLRPQGVAPGAARATVKNLARAGVIARVGEVKVPDSARKLTAYDLVSPAPATRPSGDAGRALASVAMGWGNLKHRA